MARKDVSGVIPVGSWHVGTEKQAVLRRATGCVVEQLEMRQLLSVSQHDALAPAVLADAHLAQPSYHLPLSVQQFDALTATVVNIPDANLEAVIRWELGKDTGDITDADMQGLTYLDASWCDVSNLSGLGYATNLTNLDLYGNQISDISALAGLTQLRNLNIGWNQISDISALAGLTQLQDLRLWGGNQISDISALAGLTQLQHLYLGGSQVSDVFPLSGLTQLQELGLDDNQISDISSLSGLAQLQYLYLDGNQIGDVSPLSGLAQLQELGLAGNQINDISALSGLSAANGLHYVDITWNILDVSPGSAAMDTIQGWMDSGMYVDYDPQHAPGAVVNFADPNLESAVRYERGGWGAVTTGDMLNLTHLYAGSYDIHDLSGLEYATNLTTLYLENNQISDISPLSGLTQLQVLGLYNNQISDVSPLAGMTQLEMLDLRANQITDISALSSLSVANGLRYVHVSGNLLDVSAGSAAMNMIQRWIGSGVTVTYLPQSTVNRAPTDSALSSTSAAEDQAAGSSVGTLTTTDPDIGDTFTYSLVSGTGSVDNGSFTIIGNQLLTAASFDYEAKSSYSIRVRTTDQGGLWVEKAFAISVLNVAEVVPTITGISNDTGISGSDGITSDRTLVINGTSEPGMTISIYQDGVFTAMVTANAAGNWLFDYSVVSLADGSYGFTATASDTLGHTTAASSPYAVKVDTSAPTVTAVYVRGSTWSSNYLAFLAANLAGSSATYGYAIPAGSGAAQLQTLPWRNLNRISIAFSEDVSIAQAQFAIVGSVGSYSVSGFAYSSADHVATWSLAAAIGPDKLYVALPGSGSSAVKDAAGNVLDGEWVNPSSYSDASSSDTFPSGNGSAGGDFAFRFDVLPGDSSGGSLGKVNVADALQTKGRSGLPVSLSTYRSDFDGNGAVNVADVLYVKSKSSVYSLPVNPPVLPVFGAVSSQVSLLQKDRSLTLW